MFASHGDKTLGEKLDIDASTLLFLATKHGIML